MMSPAITLIQNVSATNLPIPNVSINALMLHINLPKTTHISPPISHDIQCHGIRADATSASQGSWDPSFQGDYYWKPIHFLQGSMLNFGGYFFVHNGQVQKVYTKQGREGRGWNGLKQFFSYNKITTIIKSYCSCWDLHAVK